MTDKVQKIREEIEKLKLCTMDEHMKFYSDAAEAEYNALCKVEEIIDSLQEEPVSEDLEGVAIQFATDTETGKVDVVKQGSFFWGAQWKERQFEKNRLKHCNSITNEQAELEQGFIDQHIDKYNRMPTFLDAIEYGMRLQKEKMMKDAVVTTVVESYGSEKVNGEWHNVVTPKIEIYDNSLVLGDKVKVIVIKEG